MDRRIINCIILFLLLGFNLPHAICQNWSTLEAGTNGDVRSLFIDTANNLLYVGGNFTEADGKVVNCLACWNGIEWDSLGSGAKTSGGSACDAVFAIAKYKGELYAAGDFSKYAVGDVIAKWNGSSWDSITSANNRISDFLVYNNELYVSGSFTSIGGIATTFVAKWNGSIWSGFGTAFPSNWTVADLIFYKDELYIGGNFIDTTGSIENIAKWDGDKWVKVGDGIVGNQAWVNAFEIYNDELIVGGLFSKDVGTNPGENIASWNGTSWRDIGATGDIYPQVRDFMLYHDYLYAVGVFINIGGVPADRIARWDGLEWCGLGSEFNNNIGRIANYQDEIIIGGGFEVIDGDSIYNNIAKWVGGDYTDTCKTYTAIFNIELSNDKVVAFPNPFTYSTTIRVNKASKLSGKVFSLTVYDIFGRAIYDSQKFLNEIIFYRQTNPAGMYFYKISNGTTLISSGRLVIVD